MSDILVGAYLFERLKQLGVKTVFGLTHILADYELMLLDLIPEAGLTWRGNPNELNAGYAADGYARVNGVGAVVTTFGPGELSNMCGIAGAYTEFVPVIHIVGYPTEAAQHGKNIMHHSLGEVGDGKFDVFHEMSKHITCATTVLHDPKTAATEIDRVYIGIPTDVAFLKTPAFNLQVPLETVLPPNNPAFQSHVVQQIRGLMDAASSPIIIVDGGAVRGRVLPEAKALVEVTGYPYFVTSMGKGSVPEDLPTFGGIYGGIASFPDTSKAIESSDCVLWLGNYPCSGEFTERVKEEVTIDFQRFFIKIGGVRYDVKMKYSIGRYFRDGDFVIAETGTSAYGIPGASLKHAKNVQMFNQTVFGSIGFATGAAVGAFVAGKELGTIKRGILVTGEGSLQLTVQAFSDLIRHEVNATVFLLNNDGYTVERLIHGMEASYNTVPTWDYGALFKAFGPQFKTKYHLVKTPDDLDALLSDAEFNAADCAQIVELILDKHDAPQTVKTATAAVEAFNKKK
ncbi:putative pyruvate decarboxylase [Stipitochalara longipes BDJ]|nr:putative pyruvate decarboxylase [Stipitochalara longipes BDJ]